MLKTSQLFGLNFVNASRRQFTDFLSDYLSREKADLLSIFTPNTELIMLAERDKSFVELLLKADLLLPDGQGLIWASKKLAKKNPSQEILTERLTGSDTASDLVKLAKAKNLKVLALGGRDHECVVDEMGRKKLILKGRQSDVYWLEGYQDIHKQTQTETKAVLDFINELKPDIILAAFGTPPQEKWLLKHKDFLRENGVRVVVGIGGGLDLLTGKLRRAPRGWQKLRLEWLYRLLQQPWRFKRQLQLPLFVWKVYSNPHFDVVKNAH
ncbi:MAG: WecB/TagA/CpsF family glycosyltransferase [Pseudomonadales bacterium]|jgi:N-acetylglucosaminyldiphosphoundecaprenol N-acetyl-beta-D-mannosaminyltransferase|nr:WecB/TagA/CpsF family glycosyltransferase [Pseudomonadales bacterium]